MRKLVKTVMTVGLLCSLSGCYTVGSTIGGNNSETGEAWWVKQKGYGLLSSKVFYCPAPASGPAQCKEAKMMPNPNPAK